MCAICIQLKKIIDLNSPFAKSLSGFNTENSRAYDLTTTRNERIKKKSYINCNYDQDVYMEANSTFCFKE